jgi:type I restriction enzyme, R subunit
MNESEWRTRRTRVDRRLRDAGWKPAEVREGRPLSEYGEAAVEEYPTESGPADYLLTAQGLPLAVVEAKKVSLGPHNALTQAIRYSRGLDGSPFDFDGMKAPFGYSTNGEKIFFQDLRTQESYSRQVSGFHTCSALQEYLGRDDSEALRWLRTHPNDHPRLRPYQVEATEAIERALSQGKRQMLVAMATGTGKTFTIASEIYRLLKSGLAKRVLFLVDRRALAAQAVQTLAAYEPEPGLKFDQIYEVYSQRFRREDFDEKERFDPKVLPNKYLAEPQASHTFVYVCTIQRMRINLFGFEGAFETTAADPEDEADVERMDIPIHAFDVVIADECHRGYTAAEISKWREVLEHFDATKIGLTATPAAHTKAYFNDVVYRYEYNRAVREGYLVDYDAVGINSGVRMNGLFLREGEQVGIVDPETGREVLDAVEDERTFDTASIEREITSPDSNRKIIEEVAQYTREHEERTGRFPKTLIFAANDLPHTSHAERIVDLCRSVFGRGDAFVQKITGSVTDRPLQRIREFRNRPNPGVVVTVDMLSTGVDIPALESIVFLRPVKSRILFEQMLGRGTRLCGEIGKTHFTVFDCFGGTLLQYFRDATAFTAEPPLKPSRTFAEIVDAVYRNQDRPYNIRCLVKRLQRVEKEISAEGREALEPFLSAVDLGAFAKSLPRMLGENFAGTMRVLRDAEFQERVTNYPRAKRAFMVAYESEDKVSSQYLFRTTDGRELKPEDYLSAFARFVQEQGDQVEALRVLLSRPRGWSTAILTELRKALASRPEHFTEEKLRRAYHHELADIISMVKHAGRGEPLLSSSERVERAIAAVTEGRSFNEDQRKWLGLIAEHLKINLAIEKEDFSELQIFERAGGWGRANKVFGGKLEQMLLRINEAVAA